MNDFERILGALRDAKVSFVIVGGVAATVHGSARLTSDVDVVYERSRANIEHLVEALSPLNPYLRGAPPGLPFRFDVETVLRGLNFTLSTDAGPVDVLGEITGFEIISACWPSPKTCPCSGQHIAVLKSTL